MKKIVLSLTFALSIVSPLLCMEQEQAQKQQWDGDEYDKNSQMQYESAMSIVRTLPIPTDDEILDLGCGTGRVSVELARRAAQGSVHAVDASESQIARASKQWKEQQNLTFEVVDGQNLPFQNRFKRLVSFHAIHWMPDQQGVFNGCFRSLRPGGQLICSLSAKDPEFALKLAFIKTAQQEKWAMLRKVDPDAQAYPQDKATVENMLQTSGFGNVEVKERVLNYKFTPDDFKKFHHSLMGGYKDFAKLKETQPELVWNLVVDLVTNYQTIVPLDDEGKLTYNVKGLFVTAQKPDNK